MNIVRKVVISTSSFGKFDARPLDMLKDAGVEVTLNPYGRKLSGEEVLKLAAQAEGLIAGTEPLDASVLRKMKNLKVISRCGVGIENVDIDAAGKMGIKVFNTPQAPVEAVAELTIGLILSLLRRIPFSDRMIREGLWEKSMGNLMNGKQIGLVGFGRIGRRTAELARAFGAEIAFFDKEENAECLIATRRMDLPELLKWADIVSIHLPLTEETRSMIGIRELSLMKEGAFLVNISRGDIVDEEALYDTLTSGKIRGAALDVFKNEPYEGRFRELDNVVLTPHIGSYAKEARIEMEIEAAKNLLQGLGEQGL